MDTVAKRLQWARERMMQYENPTAAARAFGWTVSTYLGYENGDRQPSRAAAKRIAKAYRVRWEWLLEAEGTPTGKPMKAQVVGYVGAGAEVYPIDDHAIGAGLEEIDLPPGAPPNSVPVIVRGDSMHPRYFDREYLVYARDDRHPDELLNDECVVKLADGRIFVKILRRGSNGRYNLESWNPTTPTMVDQAIEWAALVVARVNRRGSSRSTD